MSSQAGRKPAQNASPAPVPSTNFSTGRAMDRTCSGRPLANSAPSGPSLTTSCGYHAVSTRAAESGSSRPVSTVAWSAFTSSSVTPLVISRNGSAPARSSGADDAPSTEIVMPARPASWKAASAAARDPSFSSVYPDMCRCMPGANRSVGRSSGCSAAFAPGSDSIVWSPLWVTMTTHVPVGRSGSMTSRASTP